MRHGEYQAVTRKVRSCFVRQNRRARLTDAPGRIGGTDSIDRKQQMNFVNGKNLYKGIKRSDKPGYKQTPHRTALFDRFKAHALRNSNIG